MVKLKHSDGYGLGDPKRLPDIPEIVRPADGGDLFEEAFDRIRSELGQLHGDELLTLNLDISKAFSIMMGALPVILSYKEQLAELPHFPIKCVSRLETYGLAAMCTQARFQTVIAPPEPVAQLVELCIEAREVIKADLASLVSRGVVAEKDAPALKNTTAYLGIASDIVTLCTFYRTNWHTLETRSSMTMEELSYASALDVRLYAVVNHKVSPEKLALASDLRARAFTLFYRAYDQVRRGVSYYRWDAGDLEQIAPTLYGTRAKKAADDADSGDAAATGDTAATGTSAPAATGTNGSVATASPATGAAVAANPMITPGAAAGSAKALAEAAANPEVPPASPFNR